MAIDMVVVVSCLLDLSLGGCLYPALEGNRVGYNMIPIRTLFLLDYYIYISMDIIIYALENMP
jgi:hypothetical protein